MIYRRYKELCPHSRDVFNPTQANARRWHRRIKLIEANMAKAPVDLSKERAAYKAAAEGRKNLPPYVSERINSCISHILERYPDTQKVWLTGSYAAGTYIDERTDKAFKALKGAVKKVKMSDFDFVIEPVEVARFIADGLSIDLLPDRNEDMIKIYDVANQQ